MYHASPFRVRIDGRPFWKFPDGHLLPVVSGGSDDGAGDPFTPAGDEGGDEGAEGGDAGGSEDSPGDKAPDPAAELAQLKAENAKLLALSRKHEARAKENFQAKQRLEQLENAGKSEAEKQSAMIAELQKEARDSRVEALKLRIAAEKGLTSEQAKFLPDLDDEVDMLAAADSLLEAFGSADKGGQPTRQPKSNLTNPLADDDAAAKREALLNSLMGKAAL
jgi:hypothetical protein